MRGGEIIRPEEWESRMKTYEELEAYMEEENVKFIRLAFFDAMGIQKNVAIMPSELRRAMKEGISFDATSIAGYGTNEKSDLFLKPELSTLTAVPWRPVDGRVVRIFCEVQNPDGTPFALSPRNYLKKAAQAAREMGLHVNVGPEMEFYAFKLDPNGHRTYEPQDHAGYMDTDPFDQGSNLRREVCYTLVDMGITPEASHHESGPGQNEVDFHYSNPLSAADNTATVKWAIRSVADSMGLWADFSPKPLRDEPGSGMHLNFSLQSGDGKDYLPQFMAGVMKYIRDMTLFLNPTQKSYLRFGEMEAPKYVSWSPQNRSQLIRIPASESPRMELRSPDAMCNPYLAYALVIYAGLEGIRQGLRPDAPMNTNLYTADADFTRRLQQLPMNVSEAVRCAQRSAFIRQYVPQEYIDLYCSDEKREKYADFYEE